MREETKKYLIKYVLPAVIGIPLAVGSIIYLESNLPNEKKLFRETPKSAYYYHPKENWSYGIDVEGDGIEDITINDPHKRIKEIMSIEGGYKIILSTSKERERFNEMERGLKKSLEDIKWNKNY